MTGLSLDGAVAVVTGGASGIGRALVGRFVAAGARAVVVADRDESGARTVAEAWPTATAMALDVTSEEAMAAAAKRIEAEYGAIDLWCSNAGVVSSEGLGDDADWDRTWRVHVLAHVYAARYVLPGMVNRGRGHFLITASAAGLLTELDTAPYAVTKHGSVALAEWLAIRYGGETGVGVSCLCPQGVRTAMTEGLPASSATLAVAPLLEPTIVADAVMEALADGRFLILPHPEVAEYEKRRSADRDRWLAGMRRVRAGLAAGRES